MQIIDKGTILENVSGTVVTIGKFDGVHRGHRKIFECVAEEKKKGFSSIVVSFVNPPSKLLEVQESFDIDKPMIYRLGQLLTEDGKREKLENMGFDYYCGLLFDEKLMNTAAEDFFQEFVISKWNVKVLVVGDDFCFGKERKGNITLLKSLCAQAGIKLVVVERLVFDGKPISSSRIKKHLEKGDIENANAMLGYAYFFEGAVVHGRKLGNTIGFPTVNLLPEEDRSVPAYGVYGSYVKIGNDIYKGITNIGTKPTVTEEKVPVIETNIIDFSDDLYGKTLKVSLIKFLRGEKKFASLDKLKEQINSDKKHWTNLS